MWQQSKSPSSSAPLANELRVLDDISRSADVKQNNHVILRVPTSEQDATEDTWRIHHKPSLALFTPADFNNGGRPEDLEKDGETHTSFTDDPEGTSALRNKWSGPKPRRSLGHRWTGKTAFRKRLMSTPSLPCQPQDIEGGLSVFLLFDKNSRKDALAFATRGEAFVAQAARKGRTEVSTKQLDSKELTALRETKAKC